MSFFAGAAAGAIASQIALHQLQKSNGSGAPAGALLCGNEGGSNPQYGIVAHTQWGNIPGKFNNSGCFFPYGGEEKSTNDFSFLLVPSGWHLEKNQGAPPALGLKVGFQNDGSGDYWLIVAHTQWGDVPGKARGSEGWFPYMGKEHYTKEFSWVVANPAVSHQLQKSNGSGIPAGAIQCGSEGGNPQFGIVAHTQWGHIPGKYNNGGCYYPYGGEEKSTKDFSFLVAPRGWHLVKHHEHHGHHIHHGNHVHPPHNALKVGFQNDGSGDYWLVVAHSQWGDVPGKARGTDCWFPYGGKEHHTKDFSWVVANF